MASKWPIATDLVFLVLTCIDSLAAEGALDLTAHTNDANPAAQWQGDIHRGNPNSAPTDI